MPEQRCPWCGPVCPRCASDCLPSLGVEMGHILAELKRLRAAPQQPGRVSQWLANALHGVVVGVVASTLLGGWLSEYAPTFGGNNLYGLVFGGIVALYVSIVRR